ncbi:MAG: dihydrolipoyllysine-residue succinyltransferase, partial [Chloroflexales bacterium]|nr:dihydrolipoyllysine-residue succinyltransferase [Chloroflexales bacterium]
MAYEIKVPALGESIVEATVARWLKREGEAVAAGEPVVELETDKVNLEVASDHAGVVGAIIKGEGAAVGIGDVLGTIVAGAGAAAAPPSPAQAEAPAAPAPAPAPAPASPDNGATAPTATPTAHNVAAEHGVDLRGMSGSGPGGRITKGDVLRTVGAPA